MSPKKAKHLSSRNRQCERDPLTEKHGETNPKIATRWVKDRYDSSATRFFVPGQWPIIGGPGATLPSALWDDPQLRARIGRSSA